MTILNRLTATARLGIAAVMADLFRRFGREKFVDHVRLAPAMDLVIAAEVAGEPEYYLQCISAYRSCRVVAGDVGKRIAILELA